MGGLACVRWLALKIALQEPALQDAGREDAPGTRPLGFMQGALLQLINPKLSAMVAGAVAAYGGALALAAMFGLIFGAATLASTLSWTLVGVGAVRIVDPRRDRTVVIQALQTRRFRAQK
jgi:threonine/homoserine/homoserine lactone efflux protein